MFEFIAGIVVIIFSFLLRYVAPTPHFGGGARSWQPPVTHPELFDPKTFVTETGWHIGTGPDVQVISEWVRVRPDEWAAQVQMHNNHGFCIANNRHVLQWVPPDRLPPGPRTEYLRKFGTLESVRGETSFLMTPYLREWQRQHMWQWVPERTRILDVGVGTGRSRDLWAAKHLQVWGVEPNARNIDELRRRRVPQVRALECMTGQDPRLRSWLDTRVDVVMMVYSITFFFESPETLEALIANIRHALTDTGRVVMIGMDGAVVDQWLSQVDSELDTPLFKIIKKYKKRATFGSEIELTVKNPVTLVESQREYLVDFDHLRRTMSHWGFQCVHDEHVRAAPYLAEWPARWCQAQRVLVWDRTGKK